MLQLKKLIQQIDRGLDNGADPIALRKDAVDFGEFCKSANERLDQCEVLIEGNQEHNAIELAEIQPSLLELVGQLEFQRAEEWREYCRENNLPVPESINEHAAQRLNELYSRISDSDHKVKDSLFKEYRAAVLEGRDEDALASIRTLAKLFPSDPAAAAQFPRLEEQVFEKEIARLGKLVDEGDDPGSAALATEIEHRFPQSFSSAPQWEKALSIRERLARERATGECRGFLEEAAGCRDRGEWEDALGHLGKIASIKRDLGIDLEPSQLSDYEAIQNWAEGMDAAAREDARFHRCIDDLLLHVEIVKGKEHRNEAVKLPELLEDRNRLVALWEEVGRFDREIESDVEKKVTRCAGTLNSEIKRKQQFKKKLMVLTGVGVLLLGGLATTYAVVSAGAQSKADELSRLRDAGEYDASVKFLDDIGGGGGLAGRFSVLKSAIAETEAWQENQKEKSEAYARAVGAIGEEAEDGFASVDISGAKQISDRLREVEAMKGEISQDLRVGSDESYILAAQSWQKRVSKLRDENIEEFKATRPELEEEIREIEVLDPIRDEMGRRVEALASRMAEFELLAPPGVDELKLPAVYEEMIVKMKTEFSKHKERAKQWEEQEAALNSADDVKAYKEGLELVAQEFSSPLAIEARDTVTTEGQFVQELLMPGEPEAWRRFEGNAFAPKLHPDPTEKIPTGDRSILRSLRDSETLGDVYLYRLNDSRNKKGLPAYSKGEIEDPKPRVVNGVKRMFQEGVIYLPWRSPDTANFKTVEWNFDKVGEGTLGDSPEPLGESAESAAFSAIDLGSYYDTAIEHYDPKSLVTALDEILANQEIKLTFKAYLHRELASLMAFRPHEWGLEWTSVEEHLRGLQAAIRGSGLSDSSWMLPSKNELLEEPLREFYDSIAGCSYDLQQNIFPNLIRDAAGAGFEYVGYVSAEGKPVLRRGVAAADEYWGYSKERVPSVLFQKNSDETAETPLPFSPLYVFKGDRAKIVENNLNIYGEVARSPWITKQLPPFFLDLP